MLTTKDTKGLPVLTQRRQGARAADSPRRLEGHQGAAGRVAREWDDVL